MERTTIAHQINMQPPALQCNELFTSIQCEALLPKPLWTALILLQFFWRQWNYDTAILLQTILWYRFKVIPPSPSLIVCYEHSLSWDRFQMQLILTSSNRIMSYVLQKSVPLATHRMHTYRNTHADIDTSSKPPHTKNHTGTHAHTCRDNGRISVGCFEQWLL